MSFANNGALPCHLSNQPMDELCDEKKPSANNANLCRAGIQRRGDNRGSKKDALPTGPTRPRNALHFRRSGMGRPPKREDREEKMRDEVASPPPNRTRRQTKWDGTRRVVKPRERRSKKVENSVRIAHINVLLLFDYGSGGRAGPLPTGHLHCVPVGPARSNPREGSRSGPEVRPYPAAEGQSPSAIGPWS